MKHYGEAHMFALDSNKSDDFLINISEKSEGWNFQHEVRTSQSNDCLQFIQPFMPIASYSEQDCSTAVYW